jgi:hypothetical protein
VWVSTLQDGPGTITDTTAVAFEPDRFGPTTLCTGSASA